MSYYTIDGMGYYAEEVGVGEPLILLHGFTGSSAIWDHQIERFRTQFRVITVDLPGHGATNAPPDIERYTMERVAADLALLLHKLDALPAHWLGYSMGGRLALYMAVKRPQLVRSVILESASPGIGDAAERQERRRQDDTLAGRIEAEGVRPFVAGWEKLPLFATQERLSTEVRAEVRKQRLKNTARGLADSLRGMGTGAQPSLWEQLGLIGRPVLLVAGELDGKFVALNHRMADAIPGAELQIIANAGHTVHLEQPEEFEEAVLNFLPEPSENGTEDLT